MPKVRFVLTPKRIRALRDAMIETVRADEAAGGDPLLRYASTTDVELTATMRSIVRFFEKTHYKSGGEVYVPSPDYVRAATSVIVDVVKNKLFDLHDDENVPMIHLFSDGTYQIIA